MNNRLAWLIGIGLLLVSRNIMEPRGIRNNNPGNIRASDINWQGKTGNDGEYEIFKSPFYGIRAMARVIRTYLFKYGLESVREIIARWAPPNENVTENYVQFVARKVGVDPDADIPINDHIYKIVRAIIQMENGKDPYDAQTVVRAINAAGWDITG